jgi:hypothetical protein
MLNAASGLKSETVYFSADEMDGPCNTHGKVRNAHKIISMIRDGKKTT